MKMKNLNYISILSVFFISGCVEAENGDSGLNTAIAITSYNGSDGTDGTDGGSNVVVLMESLLGSES